MAKQTELRALLNEFTAKVQRQTALVADRTATFEQRDQAFKLAEAAEQRIFSFFDQMRQTIDGLVKNVESKDAILLGVTRNRDEAVRQVAGLVQHMASVEHQLTLFEATNEKLRKGDVPVAEDTFVPLDLARKDGLEVLVGMPGVGKWLPATYIGHTPSGFHVVEATGHGIVAITDAAAGLRHRIKAKPMKTVTMYANLWRETGGNRNTGVLYETEESAIKAGKGSHAFAVHAATVKVTVAE